MASLAAERSTYGHVVIVIAIVIERVTTSVKHKRYVVDLQTVQLSGLLARERARPALLYLSPPLWQTPSGVGGLLLLLLLIIITINIHININIRIKSVGRGAAQLWFVPTLCSRGISSPEPPKNEAQEQSANHPRPFAFTEASYGPFSTVIFIWGFD